MSVAMPQRSPDILYDATILFWRTVVNIFFREIRPRGAFNIPKDGPVIFVAAPHHNQVRRLSYINHLELTANSIPCFWQFLDPLLLLLQVYRESHRRVEFLTAAASMKRKFIGFASRLVSASKWHAYSMFIFKLLSFFDSSRRQSRR